MHELTLFLKQEGYTVERMLSAGNHGSCYLVRKNGICYILKKYESNAKEESIHESTVYTDLHGAGMGNEYFFKAEPLIIDNTYFLLSQTYEGVTLEEYIQLNDNLSLEDKLNILMSACKAINEMHNLGYIHLDIKPSNLYLSNAEHIVKPIDMGSAVKCTNGKSFDEIINSIGYLSTREYSSKKVRDFNELCNKLRDKNFSNTITEKEKKQLCDYEHDIGRADDIYGLMCCAFFVFTKKRFKYWLDKDVIFINDMSEIRQALINNQMPDYLIEKMVDFFCGLLEPYKNRNAEVPYNTMTDLIKELNIIKEIEKNIGFHSEILLRNFKRHFDNNLKQYIEHDKGFDEMLLARITEIKDEDINEWL